MNDKNIINYREEIINTILKRINEEAKEIIIEIVTGIGLNKILTDLVKNITSDKILILTNRFEQKNKLASLFKDHNNIEVSNINNLFKLENIKYIIICETENISKEYYEKITKYYDKANFILFCNHSRKIIKDDWLKNKKKDYVLTLQEAILNGYINPLVNEYSLMYFVDRLLRKLNFNNIKTEVPIKDNNTIYRLDFVVNNSIIEVKNYRSVIISTSLLEQSVNRLSNLKNIWEKDNLEEANAILIVSCFVNNSTKEKYYNDKKILILDIANLIYLCQYDSELMNLLLGGIKYNVSSIIPTKPIVDNMLAIVSNKQIINDTEISLKYIQELENIKPGIKDSKRFEKTCEDVIKYLFDIEFTKMESQKSTDDRMFIMDMICCLKGVSEFWKILIQHYNTRFVVFEFKNYEDEIDQNLIYITEKYLYNAVLRNVAIIISRKGFSLNAKKAANGELTEKGKLIIDISDYDLITMLRMKADGENASDYLLSKLEDYLMSISK